MEKNQILNTINNSISSSGVYMGTVLWAVLQGQPMLYEQEDVADALSMRHGLMQKTIIPLNPQIETGKPEIWEWVSSITIWHILKAKCLKVFRNVTDKPIQNVGTSLSHNIFYICILEYR